MLERVRQTAQILTLLACADLHAGGRGVYSRRLLRILLLIAACTIVALSLKASAAEPAREPVYNVELVVFRSVTPLGVPEDWKAEASAAATAGDSEEATTAQAVPGSTTRLAANALPSAQFRLSGIETALARSRGYEILSHFGWTQTATPFGGSQAVDLADLGTDGQALRGTAALERGRYLHLRLNLNWSPETPPASLVSATGPVTFTLKQQRRIRPFERHYFDHPAFGVIAMVSPVSGAR